MLERTVIVIKPKKRKKHLGEEVIVAAVLLKRGGGVCLSHSLSHKGRSVQGIRIIISIRVIRSDQGRSKIWNTHNHDLFKVGSGFQVPPA